MPTKLHLPRTITPTLEDVAREAKVSTSTISRCLNNPEKVAESTRLKIHSVVNSLGYSPNFGAKALATNRTNSFGAVIPTMSNAIFARGLQAFQKELALRGSTLLLASSYYDPIIEEKQIREMIARGADGLLLIGKNRSAGIYRFLEQREIPFVIGWAYARSAHRSYVGFDNRAAFFEMTVKAINLGHRHFGVISAERMNNDRAKERVNGVFAALDKHSIDRKNCTVIETPYSIETAGVAFRILIDDKPETTIAICGNDVQAVGALKMAKAMGLSIPEDISITGCDNLELSSVVEPPITTVAVPDQKMGELAAKVLLEQVQSQGQYQQIKLPTNIVERETLAAPRIGALTQQAIR